MLTPIVNNGDDNNKIFPLEIYNDPSTFIKPLSPPQSFQLTGRQAGRPVRRRRQFVKGPAPGPHQVHSTPAPPAASRKAQISIRLPASCLRRRRSTRAQLSRSSAHPTRRQLPERRRYPSTCRQPAAGGCARYLPGTCQVHH